MPRSLPSGRVSEKLEQEKLIANLLEACEWEKQGKREKEFLVKEATYLEDDGIL